MSDAVERAKYTGEEMAAAAKQEPGTDRGDAHGSSGASSTGRVLEWFCHPRRIAVLLAATVTGGCLGVILQRPPIAAAMESLTARSGLLEAIYLYLALYDPLLSWWMILLTASISMALLARAIFADSRVALIASVGSLLLPAGALVEASAGLSGEMLLREGEAAEEVHVRSPPNSVRTRRLGFDMLVSRVDADGVEVVVGEERISLPPLEVVEIEGASMRTRLVRVATGEERLTLAVGDRATGAEVTRTVSRGEVFSGPGRSSFEVVAYSADFAGLGPAVRVKQVEGEDALPPEGVWVFLGYPRFDRDNRTGRYVLSVMDVTRPREAIVSVSRHPGYMLSALGAVFLLVGSPAALRRRKEQGRRSTEEKDHES